MIYDHFRNLIRTNFSELRNLAANAKSEDQTIDEEVVFLDLVGEMSRAIRHEYYKLFSEEKTTELLSIWPRKKN